MNSSAYFFAQKTREERLQRRPPLRAGEIAAREFLLRIGKRQDAARGIIARDETGQRRVFHQHQKFDFRLMFRRRWIKTGWAIFEGKETVVREIAIRDQINCIERLWRKALDGIAIERGETHGKKPSQEGTEGPVHSRGCYALCMILAAFASMRHAKAATCKPAKVSAYLS